MTCMLSLQKVSMSVRNMIKPAMLNKDEDEEVIVRKRMKKTKTFEDYVEGMSLSLAE